MRYRRQLTISNLGHDQCKQDELMHAFLTNRPTSCVKGRHPLGDAGMYMYRVGSA